MLKKTLTLILALAVICSAGLFTSYAVDGSSTTETVGAIAVEDRVNELKAEKEKLLEEYNDTTDLKTKLEIADKMLDIDYSINYEGVVTGTRYIDKDSFTAEGLTGWDDNFEIYDTFTGKYVK